MVNMNGETEYSREQSPFVYLMELEWNWHTNLQTKLDC